MQEGRDPPPLQVEYTSPRAKEAVGPSPGDGESPEWSISSSAGTKARRRNNGSGGLAQLLGIFGGGALGVVGGYLLVCFLGGPEYNFLDIAMVDRFFGHQAKPVQEEAAGPPREGRNAPANPRASVEEQGKNATDEQGAGRITPPPRKERTFGDVLNDGVETPMPEFDLSDLPPPSVGVRADKLHNQKEIEAAIAVWQKALDDKPAISRAEYLALSNLAKMITLVDEKAMQPELISRIDEVRGKLSAMVKDEDARRQIARHARDRMRSGAKPNQGIAIAGELQETVKEGPLFRHKFKLDGEPGSVVVMAKRNVTLPVGASAVVLGCLVPEPRKNLVGYQGEEQVVIWGGLLAW